MSAELYVKFDDIQWFKDNLLEMKKKISMLPCCKLVSDGEYWLVEDDKNVVGYDVRIFFEDNAIFLEVSFHPEAIEITLSSYLNWLRSCTGIKIFDEDGLNSCW